MEYVLQAGFEPVAFVRIVRPPSVGAYRRRRMFARLVTRHSSHLTRPRIVPQACISVPKEDDIALGGLQTPWYVSIAEECAWLSQAVVRPEAHSESS